MQEETKIKNLTIQHEHRKINRVTIDGVNLGDVISSGFNSIEFNFDPTRPDNANIIVPDEYEPMGGGAGLVS